VVDRHGLDSTLRASGVGRLVVLLAPRSGDASLAKSHASVMARPANALQWTTEVTGAPVTARNEIPFVVDARAGAREWRSRCLGCWPARGTHHFVAGRT